MPNPEGCNQYKKCLGSPGVDAPRGGRFGTTQHSKEIPAHVGPLTPAKMHFKPGPRARAERIAGLNRAIGTQVTTRGSATTERGRAVGGYRGYILGVSTSKGGRKPEYSIAYQRNSKQGTLKLPKSMFRVG